MPYHKVSNSSVTKPFPLIRQCRCRKVYRRRSIFRRSKGHRRFSNYIPSALVFHAWSTGRSSMPSTEATSRSLLRTKRISLLTNTTRRCVSPYDVAFPIHKCGRGRGGGQGWRMVITHRYSACQPKSCRVFSLVLRNCARKSSTASFCRRSWTTTDCSAG